MKKVLIVEDSKMERDALVKVIQNIDENIQTLTTDKLGEAFQYAVQNNINLFIVDIVLNPRNLNDTSGMDFVESLRELSKYKYVPIIFVTGLNEPRLYAYEGLHCYQYIQKPLLYSEVEKIVRETLDFTRVVEKDTPLKIKQDGILYVIPKHEVIYANSRASKMTIVTIKGKYSFFYLSCNTLMDMLQMSNFTKCNRSTIINCDYIASVDDRKNLVEIKGCTEKLRIGKNFKKAFLKGFYEINGVDFMSQ